MADSQTRFYIGEDGKEAPGNCFQACLAALLQLPLTEVPDEVDVWTPGMPARESWPIYWKRVVEFLAERNLFPLELQLPKNCPAVVNILTGPSPRDKRINHCILANGEEPFWDPHPSGQFVLSGSHTHMFMILKGLT